jgi:hypothetical protein
MKTQATNPAQNLSGSRERFRTGLIFGGIVVAIIVSIFLVQDAGARPSFTHLIPKTSSRQLTPSAAAFGVEAISNLIASIF